MSKNPVVVLTLVILTSTIVPASAQFRGFGDLMEERELQRALSQTPPQTLAPTTGDYSLPYSELHRNEQNRLIRTTFRQKDANTAYRITELCTNEKWDNWQTTATDLVDLHQAQEYAAGRRLAQRQAIQARREALLAAQDRHFQEKQNQLDRETYSAPRTYVERDAQGRVIRIIEAR